jgi:hypothetical protein
MTAIKGPLTPPLARQGPQGLVKAPKVRGPRDQSVKGVGTAGHPSATPRPKSGK